MQNGMTVIRDIDDSELIKICGGQSSSPKANVRVNLNPGQCRNLSIGNFTQEVCAATVESSIPVIKGRITTGITAVGVICAICGLVFAYRADLVAEVAEQVP